MESGLRSVFSLFDGAKVFHIPDYQRPYAWGKKQLDDLVDDLENQRSDRSYFLGTILLKLRETEEFFTHIDIVDGQQRITTIIIFMKLILERLKSNDDVTIPQAAYLKYHHVHKLQVLELDGAFFQGYILEGNPLPEDQQRTPSQRRLWFAKTYLEKKLEEHSANELRKFQTVLSNAKILTYIVDNPSEAALIFETTNDRGKGLTNLERTKSFLMYKAYVAYEHPEPQLSAIQQWFSEVYRDYDDIRDQKIGEDTILQYHFTAFEKWGTKRSYKGYQHYVPEVKSHVNAFIKDERYEQAQEFIERYPREMRESFGAMKTLLLSSTNGTRDLLAVGRPGNFFPLLIKTSLKDKSSDQRKFKKIARLTEIYAFRVLGIRRRRSDTGRDPLYALARDFDGDFVALVSVLKEMILDDCPDESFLSRLMSPSFYDDIYRSDQRYLFWQYENYLRRSEAPVASAMSFETFAEKDTRTRLTIEHIAPQNPRPRPIITDTAIGPSMTEEFAENHLHCLGNLTFDPASANASKGNNDVEAKNQKHFRKAPFKTQNELDDFLNKETGKWDETSIEKRREKIVRFAMDYWDPRRV